jgi:hypothetical protein
VKADSGFNGTVKVSIFDYDGSTLLSSQTVSTTSSWAQFTATPVTPAAGNVGLCLVRLEVEQGAHALTDSVYIDDIATA